MLDGTPTGCTHTLACRATLLMQTHPVAVISEIRLIRCLQVACVAAPDELPAPLRRCFSHELEVAAPDRGQRRMLLAGLFGGAAGLDLSDAMLNDAAAQTAGADRPLQVDVRHKKSATIWAHYVLQTGPSDKRQPWAVFAYAS